MSRSCVPNTALTRFRHVDPEKRTRLLRFAGQGQHVLHARAAVAVEAEVRELDGNLRRQLAALDLVEHSEVMIPHRFRFAATRYLLTQLREHAAETGLAELRRGVERRVERLAGHEAARGSLEEAALT